jgi:SAM-dependent methyltransferase
MFFNAVSFSDTKEVSFLQSKKGVGTVLTKYHKTPVGIELSHDHEKTRYISANSQWLIDLGLATQEGKIYNKAQDKFKQINKYVELLAHLLIDYPIDKNIKIADMGSGKGYLTFALYEFLIKTKNLRCRMTGYEIREDIVTLCNQVALKNEFVGLNFQQKSIEDTIVDDVDMVIALHACNIATDMAIVKGIQAGSQYIIVAPCCHKQVRSAMKHENDLTPILKHGIMEERQAELLTDGIRSLMLEAYGYKTQIFEFISTEHTSKNIMITGVKKTGFNPDMIEKIEKIKILFGIDYHYLQKSMEEWENNKGA